MYDIEFKSKFDVDLIQHVGNDEGICKAARVSTLGSESINSKESEGLITFLMRNRHGTPFEHNLFTFGINAPIFVWREFMRHRIGFSYNEESARYKTLNNVFYIPPVHRALVQVGKAGEYTFEQGSFEQSNTVTESLTHSYQTAWNEYQIMLDKGVAKEVARMCLPTAIYSSAYVTCNARSLMSFLSLRTRVHDSLFPSFPQWEIEQVANQMEIYFAEEFPLTHKAFNAAQRVAP